MEGTSKMAGLNDEGHHPETSLAMDGHDESIFGSENYGAAVAQPAASEGEEKVPERKKHRRHTPYQTQELERFYDICPNPTEKQRVELGNRIGLENKQVKYWFQNKKTQMKVKQEQQELVLLKEEYDKLRLENMAMKEYATAPLCNPCGSLPVLGESSNGRHDLVIENAKLKEDLKWLREHRGGEKILGKPISEAVNDLSHMVNAQGVRNYETTGLNFGVSNMAGASTSSAAPRSNEYEGCLYLQVATASMEEVVMLTKSDSPFWRRNEDTGTEVFDHKEYRKKLNPIGVLPPGFAIEASRDKGLMIISTLALVNVLMDPRRWVEMFPSFVVKASIVEVLCNGVDGTHDGELLLMTAELLFPSPFVPMRRVRFIRYCRRHPNDVWTVVDLSVDLLRDAFGDATKRCRRFPSGFIMLDLENDTSAVTCFEHAEYDEDSVHQIFRPLVRSGLCFGAHRWLAALQRRCESQAFLAQSRNNLPRVPSGATEEGRRSLQRLTRRVISSFCVGLCASPTLRWEKLHLADMNRDLQAMTRVSVDEPGEVSGVLVSLSTSILLPVSREKIYNFLFKDHLRGHWDLLTKNGPMMEILRINKSSDPTSAISVLCPSVGSSNSAEMAVVQETWSDKTMSGVVYSPIDLSTANRIIEGGDSSFARILPSGFVINDGYVDPDGPILNGNGPTPASLLTLGFQLSMGTIPTQKLTVDSIQTLTGLMDQVTTKIKDTMLQL